MIRFACPVCKTILQADPAQAGTKLACAKCGQRLQVPVPPSATQTVLGSLLPAGGLAAAAPQAPAPAQDACWHYSRQGQQSGPFTFPQLQELAAAGQFGRRDLVWRKGMGTWLPAEKVGGLIVAGRRGLLGRPLTWFVLTTTAAAAVAAYVFVIQPRLNPAAPTPPAVAQVTQDAKKDDQKPAEVKPAVQKPADEKPAPKPADLKPAPKPADSEKKPEPAPKKSLKDLFVQLSPSVPLIDCPGVGGGSGFLVTHGGRRLVVTNRHVVENARNGVEVHFVRPGQAGAGDRLVVKRDSARLVAVHRSVDVAVIDVTAAAEELDKRGIRPVVVAAGDHAPSVGERVFAIGHPAGDAQILEHTLSDGIISAVNRKDKFTQGTFLQMTVAINPGNSGGPIFDDNGKVIGVATFTTRKGQDGRVLESLNFGLETRWVHEILNDPSKSLSGQEIVAMLQGGKGPGPGQPPQPPPQPLDNALVKQFQAKFNALQAQGYKPLTGDLKTSGVDLKLKGQGDYETRVKLLANDQVYIFVLTAGNNDVDLFVYDAANKLIVEDIRVNPDPEVAFTVFANGEVRVRVANLNNTPTEGVMVVMLK